MTQGEVDQNYVLTGHEEWDLFLQTWMRKEAMAGHHSDNSAHGMDGVEEDMHLTWNHPEVLIRSSSARATTKHDKTSTEGYDFFVVEYQIATN